MVLDKEQCPSPEPILETVPDIAPDLMPLYEILLEHGMNDDDSDDTSGTEFLFSTLFTCPIDDTVGTDLTTLLTEPIDDTPPPPSLLLEEKNDVPVQGCVCETGCNKLYCRCLKEQRACTEACHCCKFSCCNIGDQHHETLEKVRSTIVARKNRPVCCNCTKGCEHGKCKCFKSGKGCSSLCNCKNCRNRHGTHPRTIGQKRKCSFDDIRDENIASASV